MKCHYEVLGVERDADEKTIKNGNLNPSLVPMTSKLKQIFVFVQHTES